MRFFILETIKILFLDLFDFFGIFFCALFLPLLKGIFSSLLL